MKARIATFGSAVALCLGSVTQASAQGFWDRVCHSHRHYCGGGTNVPEIDVSSGLLAVAAVAATLALVWELRRRRG